MGIDWSKAPSWAKTVGKNGWNELAWLSDKGYSYFIGNGGFVDFTIPRAFKSEDFTIVSFRPFESVWNGEDLPPVGTVCEFAGFNPEETTFYDPVVGDKITVIAHYLSGCVQVAAFTYNCATNFGSLNVAQGAHGCFRPIRTADQIAADQKQQEIQELMVVLGEVPSADYEIIAEAIQKAGWRKQASE